ncbi:hypothetical protein DFQ27_009921 [Actinomortierella ambigua]|uniref:Rrp15p-domain-containing protein n=1 Tax=Actinomortierella ambigua TaxID=1343610 RepID=A0A9P6QEM3_9FUNG|nr:hypothetical protein DFQ27_009921 [Actinomortierella ambigua]
MKRPAANDRPAAKRQDTGAQPKSILKKRAATTAPSSANTKKTGSSEAILRANTKTNAKSTATTFAPETGAKQQKDSKAKSLSKNPRKPETATTATTAATKQKGAPSTTQKQHPKAVLKLGGAQRKSGAVKKPAKRSAAGSDSDNDGEDERDSDGDAADGESDSNDEVDDDDDLEGIQAPTKKTSKKNTEESMAEAMSKILGSTLRKADASQPILARSRGVERKLEEEKLEAKARKALTFEKRRAMNKDRVKPDFTGMEYEKKLRKVATRGVVQLFNAIKAQQKVTETVTDKIAPIGANAKDKVANMTKASFLDLLKSGTKVAAV